MALRRFVAFASAAAAVAAACSTFDEAPPGGAGDGGTDGPTTTADAMPADGGSDAWVPCSMRGTPDGAHFCDDFDRQGSVASGWDNLIVGGEAAGELFDDGTSGTPPRSFRARLPANPDPPGRAQLQLAKASPPSRYRLELDVRVDSIPHPTGTAGFSHLAVIQFTDAPCLTGTNRQRSIELSFYPNNERTLVLGKGVRPCPGGDAGAPSTNYDFPIKPIEVADKKFRHVSITIARASCPNTQSKMSMFVAFGALTSGCIEIGVDLFTDSPSVTAYVGAYVGGAGYESTAYVYDNVTVDLE